MPASLTDLPASWGRSSLFLATVLPFLAPRITVDSDFQAVSLPILQGGWPEARGWALPLPQASNQGTWPAVPESHFIASPFSPGPSSWSSCGVAWCLPGSEDGLGLTTHPCLWGGTVVWGQPALPPWAHQRPFSGSQFSLIPKWGHLAGLTPGLTPLPGLVLVSLLGPICSSPSLTQAGSGRGQRRHQGLLPGSPKGGK